VSSERQKEYAKYIRSEGWKQRRDKFRTMWGNECACCQSKENLNVHHINYDNLGNEKLEDVVLLCKGCHIKAHKGKLRVWFFTEEEYEAFQKIKHIITDNLCDYITFVIKERQA
jgi:5-methylcytosine-specific restriction endonuclease McrA